MITLAQLAGPQISWMAIAPVIALGLGAAIVLLVDVQWKPATARPLAVTTGTILAAGFVLALIQWGRMGDIAASDRRPFGGMVVIDGPGLLGTFVLLVVAALGIALGWRLFDRLGRRRAEALALVMLSTSGFVLMAMSGHLMMTFLGLEIGSIALYVLAGITRGHAKSDEAAMKYFLMGSVASAIFIYGVALTFAATGSLSISGVAAFVSGTISLRPGVMLMGIAMLVVGLTFKVSAVPFHAWAPDVYQGAPAGIVGFMASAAKVGAFVALWRILDVGFIATDHVWGPVVAGIAAASMVVGAVLAVVQDDVRRLLAYSGVAHAGFILTGLVGGEAAIDGIWFYLAVYTLQLVGAFGVVAAVTGSVGSASPISAFAGLGRRQPGLAAMFTILLLGMSGLPLTSGFIAKFGVFRQAWEADYQWLVIVAVLASVVAFFFYLRVIVVMYMQEPEDEAVPAPSIVVRSALAIVAAATIFFGILPTPLLQLAGDALTR